MQKWDKFGTQHVEVNVRIYSGIKVNRAKYLMLENTLEINFLLCSELANVM
jgi:hypothetical protein